MKWIIYMLGVLLLVSMVYAVDINDACSSRGFNHTVSSWIWDSSYIEVENNGYNVNVVGDARKLNWSSDVFIDGVVYKSGTRTYLSDAGYNGTIPKTTLSNDIVFVVFCQNNAAEIPEFTVIGAMIIVFAGIGIILFRKRL